MRAPVVYNDRNEHDQQRNGGCDNERDGPGRHHIALAESITTGREAILRAPLDAVWHIRDNFGVSPLCARYAVPVSEDCKITRAVVRDGALRGFFNVDLSGNTEAVCRVAFELWRALEIAEAPARAHKAVNTVRNADEPFN